MSLVSQKLVTDLSEELEHSFEYRAPGSILVCESDEEMEAAQRMGKSATRSWITVSNA